MKGSKVAKGFQRAKVLVNWDPLMNFCEKSLNAEIKLKGGPFSLARGCMQRGKKKNFFGSVPWANRYILATP